MADNIPKIEISHLSQDFTEDGITVDIQIHRIEGNDGWTLEVVIDEGTAISWTDLFETDQKAWDEFATAVAEVGLARLLETDEAEEVTIH